MRNRLNPLLFKSKYLFGSILLLFLAATCIAFTLTEGNDFEMARREVLLRKIGHELLLQSGDSTSRVLPVKKVANNNYQVSFEHAFTFQPEALVKTTRRLLATDPLTGDYIVKVMNCGSNNVAFGFAISSNEKENIIACKGRLQPKDCYIIDIEFKKGGLSSAQKGYLLGSLPLLAFVGLLFLKSVKPQKGLAKATELNTFNLGAMLFDVQNRQLIINGNAMDLTRTESRLLSIFALSPNETISRSRLQKEIWEDEGVIVGRSLDMFISKLRKKMEHDPAVRITNVHGKGYKLETGN